MTEPPALTTALTTAPTSAPASAPASASASPLRAQIDTPGTSTPSVSAELGAPPEPASAGTFTFAQRLQRLATRARAFTRPTDMQLAERLGGTLRTAGLIEIEHRHPLDRLHGRQSLASLARPDLRWLTTAEADRPTNDPAADLVFIDTETTGLAGGTGTLAFLIGVAQVRGDALVFTQWLITRFSAEVALLETLSQRLSPQVEWVTYNGKSFDLPLLSTRLKLARLADSLSGRVHHDLLHPTRTAFGRHWPDCRLQTAEQRLLGVHREHDLPGHRIPAVWADFVQFGDTSELASLVEHNRVDLLSLAALVPALSTVYLVPLGMADRSTGIASAPGIAAEALSMLARDSASIARMQVRRRRPESARAHLTGAEASLDARALLELAVLHRARHDWPNATRLWRELAERGAPAGHEALAKYHEHVTHDFDQALRWCNALSVAAPGLAGVERRRERLLQKLRRADAIERDIFVAVDRPGTLR
ncbi:MAG: ribonuclease H-like domain-containing protein [Proteobacteria bacterium]|nr:ribonuclease H-like domain-containing protein [Burkholderiales bacterium]